MRDVERALQGRQGGDHYRQALEAARRHSVEFAQLATVVPAESMVWEDSPQGRIKHMVNEHMGVREFCLDAYQQLLEPGEASGKHRHFSEEMLFVLEGEGYDLHWDPIFEVEDRYEWRWEEDPKRFEWRAGDFIYVPPYAIHQHVADAGHRVRLISATSRIVKAMGLDGLEQIEPSARYRAVADEGAGA